MSALPRLWRAGAVAVAPFARGGAELHVGGRRGGTGADGAARVPDRRGQVARALEGKGEVVARLRMRGLQPDRFLELRERARRVARPPERGPEVVARVEQLRVELHRLPELGDRVVGPSCLAAHEAEPVVDLRA